MRFALALFLLLTFALPARAQYAIRFPDPERFTLPNGLEVVLDPMPGRHEVAVLVSYHVGMRDQRPGWTGLAHLTEHLMFQGSLHVAEDGFFSILERVGASERNAVTRLDRTEYFASVPSEELETLLFLESDRMAYLLASLDEARIAEQRSVVERERVERRVLNARGTLPSVIAHALYPEGHPYRDADELPTDLRAISLPAVRWFVQSYYQPRNATLVVSGGFDPARARRSIEHWFGPIRASGPRVAPVVAPRVRLEGEHRLLVGASLPNDEVRVIWPTPAYGAPGDAELDVVAHVLEERMRTALVERGVALETWAQQASQQLVSEFSVGAVIAGDRGASAVVDVMRALDHELDAIENGIDAALVARVNEVWFDHLVSRMEAPISRASMLSHRMFDGTPYTVAMDARRYQAVDAERVRRAVRRLLPRDRRLVVILDGYADAPEGGVLLDQALIRSER